MAPRLDSRKPPSAQTSVLEMAAAERRPPRQRGTVEVRLFRHRHATVLQISDDGTGFDPAPALGNPQDGHFGLRILTDLAADAGADLLLATAPGAGCRWRLEVPDP